MKLHRCPLWLPIGISLACGVAMAAKPCPPSQVTAQGGTSAATTCPATGAFSTDFSATENPLSESGKWVDGKVAGLDWNNPQTVSGKAYASVLSGANGSRYDDSIAHVNATARAFTANQYAQATVFRVDGYSATHEVELLLRFSISAHDAHGYEVLWGLTGYVAVVRWNGPLGNYTALYDPGPGSAPIPKDGDVLRAEISGDTITVKINNSSVATVNITGSGGNVWSAGQPGMGFWPVDGAVPQNFGWKSFEASSL